jgi:ATP-dependent protease ClpP protease subunit
MLNPLPYTLMRNERILCDYEVYLSGEIGDPEEYAELIHTIRYMQPEESMYIRLNTGGGNSSTMIQIRNAMLECQGTIITSAEGDCMSAGTVLFLSGHGMEVRPHIKFLCHNYSGGNIGKGSELWNTAKFDRKWSVDLMKDVYKYFLTEEELDQLLEDRDFIFTAEEVLERCKVMVEKREAEMEADSEVEEEEVKTPCSSCSGGCNKEETPVEEEVDIEEEDSVLLEIETPAGDVIAVYNTISQVLDLGEGVDKLEKAKYILSMLKIAFEDNDDLASLKVKIVDYLGGV